MQSSMNDHHKILIWTSMYDLSPQKKKNITTLTLSLALALVHKV